MGPLARMSLRAFSKTTFAVRPINCSAFFTSVALLFIIFSISPLIKPLSSFINVLKPFAIPPIFLIALLIALSAGSALPSIISLLSALLNPLSFKYLNNVLTSLLTTSPFSTILPSFSSFTSASFPKLFTASS